MFCPNCGTKVEDAIRFCPNCGAEIAAERPAEPEPVFEAEPIPESPKKKLPQFTFEMTGNQTEEFTEEHVAYGKSAGVMCYLGLPVLAPLFLDKVNPFVRFHVNQGVVLFALEIIVSLVFGILSGLLTLLLSMTGSGFFGVLLGIIGVLEGIFSLLLLVLVILGIVAACKGEAKPLPLLGKIRIVK